MKTYLMNLIIKLMTNAIYINSVTKHHILVDFSGHVNYLHINYFIGGYQENKEGIRKRINLDDTLAENKLIDELEFMYNLYANHVTECLKVN